MSTSDDAPLELPCCEAGRGPDPCPYHPGFIVLPPLKSDTKRIVDQVFHEMGVSTERLERNVDEKPQLLEDGIHGHAYRPPLKPMPYLGDRRVVPWGLIVFFMALAVACAFAIGWSLNKTGLL